MLAATAGTGQFVFGQVMDDFDARQVSGQRLRLPRRFAGPTTSSSVSSVAIHKNKKHRVEYRDFDIQLDQGGQAVDGFSKIHQFGVEVDFFRLWCRVASWCAGS